MLFSECYISSDLTLCNFYAVALEKFSSRGETVILK